MKIIRYSDPGRQIHYAALQPDGSAMRLDGDPFAGLVPTRQPADITQLLAPVAPAGLLCIGLNYRRHAEETGAKLPVHPILFMKGLNAVQNPDGPILIPTHMASREVDYEAELAVVIAKSCKNISRQHAMEYVLGYTCANDVSARDWQKHGGGGQWCRGKSFDTFAPLGPCLVTPDEIPDPNNLRIKTTLNDQVVQDWTTADMIFDIPELIEYLSSSTTLLAGTVILTGTPHGVGMARKPPLWLQPGDQVTVEIEKIGALHNDVQLESPHPQPYLL